MTLKARIVADDGLTIVERIDESTDFSNATLEELRAWLPQGFEGTVARVEEDWQAHVPEDATLPEPLTYGWYARSIVSTIARLRATITHDPALEGIVLAAMRVGRLTEDAKWRFTHGTSTRTGIKRRTCMRHAGKASGAARRKRNQDRRQIIDTLARQIRRTHPYQRATYSTRQLALTIARKLKPPVTPETVRATLRALQII